MRAERCWLLLLPLPPLLWPALLNGYPIVFSDTGTYLSQAIHLYLGWDRPAFYSLFMMVLLLALAALTAVNFAAHRVASPSPFGNVFLLARVIYDGPGLRVLQRECPRADILAAVWAEPWTQLRVVAANTMKQLGLFSSGDGLHAWPETVSPWIVRDFPVFERQRYEAARQTQGSLVMPSWIEAPDRVSVLFGLVALAVVFVRALRRSCPSAGLCAAVFLAVLGNAVITGGPSTPYDRYQSRVVWLPAAIVLLALPDRQMLAELRSVRGVAGNAILLGSSIRSRAYA